VPIDGGEPVRLTNPFLNIVARGFSPDGKRIAYIPADIPAPSKRLAIASSTGKEPIKIIDLPPTALPRKMQWTPDGQGITYIDTRRGVSNIWVQPLDGSPPKQLTNFKEYSIGCFAWSPDGKYLVYNRGFGTSDIVLINSTK
jgi:Tol biopolymer transport system component